MNKEQFKAALYKELSGLEEEDLKKSVEFYTELTDDRMEEGLSEEEAVASLGTVREIATQILSDTPLPKLVKARLKPKRALRVWEILFLVLGSPVWLSMVAAAVVVVLSVYIVLWSVLLSVYAVDLSLAVCAAAGVAGLPLSLAGGNVAGGFLLLSGGLVCAGLSVFLFLSCNRITKGIVLLSKKIILRIKSCFIKKERV